MEKINKVDIRIAREMLRQIGFWKEGQSRITPYSERLAEATKYGFTESFRKQVPENVPLQTVELRNPENPNLSYLLYVENGNAIGIQINEYKKFCPEIELLQMERQQAEAINTAA